MIKRADGRYQEAITINGKRKFFYGKTKAEVLRKMREFNENETRGELFRSVADRWYSQHETETTYNAHVFYKTMLKNAQERFGNRRMNEITSKEISLYINELALKRYARRTVQGYLTMFCLIYDYAVLNGYAESNPARLVKLPKTAPAKKRELPDQSDIEKIKKSLDLPFGLFAYFLMLTGLRRGEALALTYDDIDFKGKRITVNKSLYWEVNQPSIKETKTSSGTRSVILMDALADVLPKNQKGYIFGGEKPLTQTVYRRLWQKYCEESGIACTPHQLRHLYATILYEAGIDEKMAQELMGHSSITVTRDIYTHIRMSRLDTAAELLNNVQI